MLTRKFWRGLAALCAALLAACNGGDKNQQSMPSYTDSNGKPYEEVQQLLKAAEYGDLKHIKKLHQAGANLSAEGSFGATPLHTAVKYRQHEVMLYLLDSGVDPNLPNKYSYTPLHQVAESDLTGIYEAELLLARGADVEGNKASGEGQASPYVRALRYRKPGLARFFLDKGASGSYVSWSGDSALTETISQRAPLALIRFAVENGADVNGAYSDSFHHKVTPLEMAAVYQRHDIFDYLVEQGADPELKDWHGRKPAEYFDLAVRHPGYDFNRYYEKTVWLKIDFESVPLAKIVALVENGAKVQIDLDFDDLTPLALAAIYQRRDIYDYLVKLGADPHYKDDFNHSAEEYMIAGVTHPSEDFRDYYIATGKLKAPQAAEDNGTPASYMLRVHYSKAPALKLFLNGTLLESSKEGYTGFFGSEVTRRFKAGENKIRVSWGVMPGERDWDETAARYKDGPNLTVVLTKRLNEDSPRETVLVKDFNNFDALMQNGLRVPAYEFSFHYDGAVPVITALNLAEVCNASEKEAEANIAALRRFAWGLYKDIKAGNVERIIAKSQLRLQADAAATGKGLAEMRAEYREALKAIHKDGLDYKADGPENLAFLPSAGGRLWHIVVLKSPEAAARIMEEVKMLPEATAEYDYELFTGKRDGGLARILPSHAAKVEGGFVLAQ